MPDIGVIVLFIFVAIFVVCWQCYQSGYDAGHEDGWRYHEDQDRK